MQERDEKGRFKSPDEPEQKTRQATRQELEMTTIRLTPKEREQIDSMAKLLEKWGFIEKPTLNSTIRYAIALLKILIHTGIRWRQWLEEEHPEQAGMNPLELIWAKLGGG